MADPWAERAQGLSVTIKVPESRKYAGDSPWLVFHGSPGFIREALVETFAPGDDVAGLPLFELVIECQQLASAVAAVKQGLGGRTVRPGSSGGSAAFAAARGDSVASEGGSAATPPVEPERDPLFGSVEAAGSVDELKSLWATNRAAFDGNAELFEAWKAKGKALKEAAA